MSEPRWCVCIAPSVEDVDGTRVCGDCGEQENPAVVLMAQALRLAGGSTDFQKMAGKVLEEAAVMGRYLQYEKAARYLDIGTTSFDKYVVPEVPCVRKGSLRIFDAKDLDGWHDRNKELVLDLKARRRVA